MPMSAPKIPRAIPSAESNERISVVDSPLARKFPISCFRSRTDVETVLNIPKITINKMIESYDLIEHESVCSINSDETSLYIHDI